MTQKIDLTQKEEIQVGRDFPVVSVAMTKEQITNLVVVPVIEWMDARRALDPEVLEAAKTNRITGGKITAGFFVRPGDEPKEVLAKIREFKEVLEDEAAARGWNVMGTHMGIEAVEGHERETFKAEGLNIPDDVREYNPVKMHIVKFNEGELSPTHPDEDGDLLLTHGLAQANGFAQQADPFSSMLRRLAEA